jgi:hypothetical protein
MKIEKLIGNLANRLHVARNIFSPSCLDHALPDISYLRHQRNSKSSPVKSITNFNFAIFIKIDIITVQVAMANIENLMNID